MVYVILKHNKKRKTKSDIQKGSSIFSLVAGNTSIRCVDVSSTLKTIKYLLYTICGNKNNTFALGTLDAYWWRSKGFFKFGIYKLDWSSCDPTKRRHKDINSFKNAIYGKEYDSHKGEDKEVGKLGLGDPDKIISYIVAAKSIIPQNELNKRHSATVLQAMEIIVHILDIAIAVNTRHEISVYGDNCEKEILGPIVLTGNGTGAFQKKWGSYMVNKEFHEVKGDPFYNQPYINALIQLAFRIGLYMIDQWDYNNESVRAGAQQQNQWETKLLNINIQCKGTASMPTVYTPDASSTETFDIKFADLIQQINNTNYTSWSNATVPFEPYNAILTYHQFSN